MNTAVIEPGEDNLIRWIIFGEDEDTGGRIVTNVLEFPAEQEPSYLMMYFMTQHAVETLTFRTHSDEFANVTDMQTANSCRRAVLYYAHLAGSILGFTVDEGSVVQGSGKGVDPVVDLTQNPKGDFETLHRVVY